MATATRNDLKQSFQKGKIPTQADFEALIDSAVNLLDDRVRSSPNDPLTLLPPAAGAAGAGGLLQFGVLVGDKPVPTWLIRHEPRDGAAPGLLFEDAQRKPAIFLQSGTGNVGIGKFDPKERLDVEGRIRAGSSVVGSWPPNAAYSFFGANMLDQAKPANYALLQGGTEAAGRTFVNSPVDIRFRISNVDQMTLAGDGTLGIGTDKTEGFKLNVAGSVKIGGFTVNDADEWPNVIWCRDTNSGWDEGLIKHSSSRGVFKKAGFGFHMDSTKEFGFWSTNWTPLFSVKGGSGDAYFKGNVGVGTPNPSAPLDVSGKSDTSGQISLQLRSGNSSANYGSNQITFGYAASADYRHAIKSRHNAGAQTGNSLDFYLWNFGADAKETIGTKQVMTLDGNGNVGIGTTTPQARLHVVKSGSDYVHDYNNGNGPIAGSRTDLGVYLSNNGACLGVDGVNATDGDNWTLRYGTIAGLFEGLLVAKNRVFVGNTLTYSSDRRAKDVLGRSPGEKDLATLIQLQVTDYTWIDRKKYGSQPHKRLIAQEVEQVFPQAVSIAPQKETVPSVYEMALALEHDAASGTLQITTTKAHDFQVGDMVDIYTDAGPFLEIPVKSVASLHRFTIACDQPVTEAFVYGRQVDDFRTVDYDAIAMLNVSATQELHRRIERQASGISARDERIAALERRVATLEGRAWLDAVESRPATTMKAPAEPQLVA